MLVNFLRFYKNSNISMIINKWNRIGGKSLTEGSYFIATLFVIIGGKGIRYSSGWEPGNHSMNEWKIRWYDYGMTFWYCGFAE